MTTSELSYAMQRFSFRRHGCAFRAKVYTPLGRGAVVAPSATNSGWWTAAVCGKQLPHLYVDRSQAQRAAREEWTRLHVELVAAPKS
jgi:hypothetical protein